MINKLPESCKDCAEYGSHFCDDCLSEMTANLSKEEKATLSNALKNLAKAITKKDT